jgi:hypothetical protein
MEIALAVALELACRLRKMIREIYLWITTNRSEIGPGHHPNKILNVV